MSVEDFLNVFNTLSGKVGVIPAIIIAVLLVVIAWVGKAALEALKENQKSKDENSKVIAEMSKTIEDLAKETSTTLGMIVDFQGSVFERQVDVLKGQQELKGEVKGLMSIITGMVRDGVVGGKRTSEQVDKDEVEASAEDGGRSR